MNIRIGGGIQKVDRVRNSVLNRKLNRVEIVAESLAQRDSVFDNPLMQLLRAIAKAKSWQGGRG